MIREWPNGSLLGSSNDKASQHHDEQARRVAAAAVVALSSLRSRFSSARAGPASLRMMQEQGGPADDPAPGLRAYLPDHCCRIFWWVKLSSSRCGAGPRSSSTGATIGGNSSLRSTQVIGHQKSLAHRLLHRIANRTSGWDEVQKLAGGPQEDPSGRHGNEGQKDRSHHVSSRESGQPALPQL